MNPKQLANILVKLVGLDLCVRAVPTLVYLVWVQLQNAGRFPNILNSSGLPINYTINSAVTPVLSAGMGVVVILLSRTIVGWLFANDPVEP